MLIDEFLIQSSSDNLSPEVDGNKYRDHSQKLHTERPWKIKFKTGCLQQIPTLRAQGTQRRGGRNNIKSKGDERHQENKVL